MKRFSRRQSGFGILEVLFATAIFIVVVGSLVSLGRLSLRNAALSTHRSQAMNLAQDGLETIRQMRDTGWMVRRGQHPTDDWLTYFITTRNAQADPECDNGGYGRPELDTDYEICYYQADNPANSEFRLRKVDPMTVSDTVLPNGGNMILQASNGQSDPGAPRYYRRTIRFEAVPSSNAACAAGDVEYTGLQFLAPNSNGVICSVANYETYQGQPLYAVKVVSTVSWVEFDSTWSVSLDTILTNWRTR